jgi:separase
VLDVQSALSTFENDRRTESVSPQPEEHIFLVLDRHVQEIPWESIPILRGRAISRIPSARFLVDRLVTEEALPTSEDGTERRKLIHANNTSFILNAAGDLKQTQERFGGWLNDMTRTRGWKGITDRHPTELELGAMLERSELML